MTRKSLKLPKKPSKNKRLSHKTQQNSYLKKGLSRRALILLLTMRFLLCKLIRLLRDRLAAGRRVLAPLTKVRILVPQPNNNKGLWEALITPLLFNGVLSHYGPTDSPNAQQNSPQSPAQGNKTLSCWWCQCPQLRRLDPGQWMIIAMILIKWHSPRGLMLFGVLTGCVPSHSDRLRLFHMPFPHCAHNVSL